MEPTGLLAEWRDRGSFLDWEGHSIFTIDLGPRDAPVAFVLHGFPTSTVDWIDVAPLVEDRVRFVAFDMLGFGLSDKPMDQPYSLFRQADLTEHVAATLGIERCQLVGHDMGQTVVAELLNRRAAGRLDLEVDSVLITNGSTLIDMANLSPIQQMWLEAPDEPRDEPEDLAALKPVLPLLFGPDHAPSDAVVDAMLDSIRMGEGDRLLPRLVRYVNERREHLEVWTRSLTEHGLPMTVAWGALDFIAVVDMAHRYQELAPDAEVIIWDDVGHWPPLEVPDRVAALLGSP